MIKNRLSELLAIKERTTGRRITRRDIASETGIPLSTVQAYARNEVKLFSDKTLAAFCDYFNCTVGDFLILEESHAEDNDHPEKNTHSIARRERMPA